MARRSKTAKGVGKAVDVDAALDDLSSHAAEVASATDDEVGLEQVDPVHKFLLVTPDRFILIDLIDGQVVTKPYSVLGGYSDRVGSDNGLCMEWADNQLYSAVYRTSWQFKFIRKNWHARFIVGAVLYALHVLDLNVGSVKINVAAIGSQDDAARAISVLGGGSAGGENAVLLPQVIGAPDFIIDMTGQASFEFVPFDTEAWVISENFAAHTGNVDSSMSEILHTEQVRTLENVSLLLSRKVVGETCEFHLSDTATPDQINELRSAAAEAGADVEYSNKKLKLIPRINLEKFAVNSAEKLRQKA